MKAAASLCLWVMLACTLAAAEEGALAKVVMVPQGPKLDGKLSDPLWQKGVLLTLHRLSDGEAGLSTTARVLCDSKLIYFGIECAENAKTVKADVRNRDGGVWTDDCIEIYLAPDLESCYKHIAVNTLATVFDQNCPVQGDHNPGWNANVKAQAAVEPGRNWKLAVSIPLKDLGATAGDNQSWRLNLTRTRTAKPEAREGEEYSWAQLHGTDFHQPASFGVLRGIDIPGPGNSKPEPPKAAFEWAMRQDLQDVQRIFPHPLDPETCWCGAASGLWVTRDAGRTWQPVPSAGREQVGEVSCLAVSPGRESIVVLGTQEKGLFISRDGGAAFAALSSGTAKPAAGLAPASQTIAGLLFSEMDHSWQTLLVTHGEAAPGVSITRDLGQSWWVYGRDRHLITLTQCGETLVGIGSMTETALKSWGLQRSIDGGEHWNEFSRGMLFSDGDFSLLRPDRFIFASRDGRVLESRDWGTGWRDVSPHADATWASAFYTFDRDAQTDLLVLYDPTRYGVLTGDALRPGRYWRSRNYNLYVGKFVRSGAACRANANGTTFYVAQNGKLWVGRPAHAQAGPTLESARCVPSALALAGEGQSFTVSAAIFHPKGGSALKQVSLDFSIAGGEGSVPLFDDGRHDDGAAGDGHWAGKVVVPHPLTWKIPPEDRRYSWGVKVFTLTALDADGKKDTLPVVINLYQPPQPLTLFDGGACFGNFGCRDDQHSFGQIEAQIKEKTGVDGKSALVIAAKDDKPWRTVWGTVYKGTFINVSGYQALAFRVKGTVSADLRISLMDCFVEKEDEQIDDFNFTRPIGVLSGGYLKAISGEYQEVVVPLKEALPPGYHFIRKRTIGMAFSMAEGGKAGTFMVDRIQLRP